MTGSYSSVRVWGGSEFHLRHVKFEMPVRTLVGMPRGQLACGSGTFERSLAWTGNNLGAALGWNFLEWINSSRKNRKVRGSGMEPGGILHLKG